MKYSSLQWHVWVLYLPAAQIDRILAATYGHKYGKVERSN